MTEKKTYVDNSFDEIQKNLSMAQEIAHIGSWKYNVETGDSYWSDELYRIYGLNPKQTMTGLEHDIGMIHPDDRDAAEEAFQTALKKGLPYEIEYRIIRPDGEERHVHGIGRAKRDHTGTIISIHGTVQDITERKRSETALREGEERYRLTLSALNEGLYDWNITENTMVFSPSYFTMLGYAPDELEPSMETYNDLLHPEDRMQSQNALKTFLSGSENESSAEIRMRTKEGSYRWILSKGLIVERDKLGKPKRMVGTNVDITTQKESEKSLQKEKIKAEQYLQLAGVMFIGLDNNGNITLANDKSCEILECCHKDIIGINWFDNFIPENIRANVRSVFQQLMEGNIEPVEYYENSVISRNGHEKIIAWHNTILKDDTGKLTGILSSGQDITIKKQYELQLLQSQKLEAIGTLAGGIAHDFNNMLGIITGNISYALSVLNRNDELFEVLSDIQEGAKQAQSLTQQLLTFARGGDPIRKAVDINGLIKESATFITRGSKSSCEFDLYTLLWTPEIDEGQINQVVSNLMLNAIQSMPDGGIINVSTENCEIGTNSGLPLPPGFYIKTIFRDQGIGIPEKHFSQIFDPFFTTKQKGNGLGLATAYSIVKRHGGIIDVESQLGEGTTFTLYLPVSGTPVVSDKTLIESQHYGNGRILIMDDQESILKMGERMLNGMGYDTVAVKDGLKAIKVYREAFESDKPFDLVILDLTVPGGLGGAETMPELLKTDPDVKAVVSSGYSNDPVMANYRDYGFTGIIPKPYTKSQMADILNEILGNTGKK